MLNTYFHQPSDLFDWRLRLTGDAPAAVTPWKPCALSHGQWPPDYRGVYQWRLRELDALEADPQLLASARAYYRERPGTFIQHWMDTYNPRKKRDKWMPFVFFDRQAEMVEFLTGCVDEGESGLIEKCRDAGATWISCAWSVSKWLFDDDFAIGWGSRKQDLVDKLGNPDSIFEKMRLILNRLPKIWRPNDYDATFMRFTNHDNGSVIMGEAGDNIGRGGRTSVYFKDESAHYPRPELIEAALGDNTNTQIDISSVNGLGNVFHNRRTAGLDWERGKEFEPGYTRVFVIDWKHHPEKTQVWYDTRKAKAEREGMQHIFAQEVDRNYSAAVQNTIIPYAWIAECVDAHKRITWKDDKGAIRTGLDDIPNVWTAGLDIADGGVDRNAIATRQYIIWRSVKEWGARDTGVTTRNAIAECEGLSRVRMMYDIIGMGSSVKSEYNRLRDEKLIDPRKITLTPWNAGAGVVNPFDRSIPDDDESPLNRDLYGNMKAQAWFSIRARFYKTWRNLTEGVLYSVDELISLDSTMPLLHQLMQELAQPTVIQNGALRSIIDKKPDGMKSPNLADAGIMAFFPVDDEGQAIAGRYSG